MTITTSAQPTPTRTTRTPWCPSGTSARRVERASGEGKLVIVDSCRFMEQEGPAQAPAPRIPARSVGVLFACSAGQNSYEVAEKRHGVLSYFIVEGLGGAADDDRDGTVTAAELVAFVKARVPKYQKDQQPELIGPVPPIEFTPTRSPSPSDKPLSPTEAASRVGQQVTVEFTVGSTGSNPAGFLELYSGQTWMEEGSFFIRFPGETQQKFEGLGIEDIRKHFARKTVRVTGVVQSMTFSTGGTHPVMVVQDMGQIKIIHTVARNTQPAPPPAPVVPSSDETGFQPLFNGRDLAGWEVDGGDGSGWRVEGGEIVALGESGQGYDFLLSDREYRNFALRFEFKVGENANSGVGIRALRGERVNGRPLNLEVQIHDDEGLPPGQGEPTGSLFWSSGGPLMRPYKPAQLKPRGEWNTMEVEVQYWSIRVAVNGQYVLNADLQPLIMNPRVLAGVYRDQGRIGLQKCTGEVRFSNVRIKELVPQPFVVLDAGGHTSSVWGAVFTPDGQKLVTVRRTRPSASGT